MGFKTSLRSLILFFCLTTNLQAKKLENLHGDWHVLTTTQDQKKVCYIASVPKTQGGNVDLRGDSYILVSAFYDRLPEVSISSGYSYQAGSMVDISLGTKKYSLSKLQGEIAWAKDDELDKRIITAMKLGNNIEVKGTAENGQYSIDTYSLMGFIKAYEEMMSLCPNYNKG